MILDGMRFLCLSFVIACQPSQISGTVLDSAGNGVSGVTVSIEGTNSTDVTTADGVYQLDLRAGEVIINVQHPDFFSRIHTIQIDESAPRQLKPTVLVRKPADNGLFVLQDASLLPLRLGSLTRDTQTKGPAKKRRFCLDRTKSEATPLPVGRARLADKNASPWRLFRLDGDGCAYRDARDSNGRWVVEYRDRPDLVQQSRDDGIALHDVQLAKGEYFIADWAGFFVAEPDNDGRYTGRWIQVDN